ncbi:MAG TPA: GNAT family N-acetyltransferase [Dehalococcoidia bacterium]|nr:GNAT family N-acetyltransferase [Dehalococcoidia bacterium]
MVKVQLGVTVREASGSDVPAVLAITRAAFEGYREEMPDYGALHETEDDIRGWLERGMVLLAEQDGVMVGSVRLAQLEDGDWYVGRLGIVPDAPGWVGSRLMREAEARAREHGGKAVRLGVLASRHRLRRYYERRGYVLTDVYRPDEAPDHPGWAWYRKDLLGDA